MANVPSSQAVRDYVTKNSNIEWQSDVTYSIDAVVAYEGALYNSKQNSNTGNTPVGGESDPWWGFAAATAEDITSSNNTWTGTQTFNEDFTINDRTIYGNYQISWNATTQTLDFKVI